MRDVGAIVWVILVVIAVVSSIVSNVRRQARTQPQPVRVQPQLPQPERIQPPMRQPVRPQAPAQPAAAAPTQTRPAVRRPARPSVEPRPPGTTWPAPARKVFRRGGLELRDRRSLARAVIAAEILGAPLALRDLTADRLTSTGVH